MGTQPISNLRVNGVLEDRLESRLLPRSIGRPKKGKMEASLIE